MNFTQFLPGSNASVPNLGVIFQNWVMGPRNLDNGLFSYQCFNHYIFYWA